MSGVLIPFLLPVYPGAPHVPHESRRPGSRRLYAGHRLASRRVSARLIPGQRKRSGSDVIKFSTLHQRFIAFAFLVPT